MVSKPNSAAERIIARFGGTSALARILGKKQSTVWSWKDSGYIPARNQQIVLDAAKKAGIDLSPEDFFERAA